MSWRVRHHREQGVQAGLGLRRAGRAGRGEGVQRPPYVRESGLCLAPRTGRAVLRRDRRAARGPARGAPVGVGGDPLGGRGHVLGPRTGSRAAAATSRRVPTGRRGGRRRRGAPSVRCTGRSRPVPRSTGWARRCGGRRRPSPRGRARAPWRTSAGRCGPARVRAPRSRGSGSPGLGARASCPGARPRRPAPAPRPRGRSIATPGRRTPGQGPAWAGRGGRGGAGGLRVRAPADGGVFVVSRHGELRDGARQGREALCEDKNAEKAERRKPPHTAISGASFAT